MKQKNEKIIDSFRKALLTLAPLALIVGFVLNMAFQYVNNKPGMNASYIVAVCACALFFAFFVLTLIKEVILKKNNSDTKNPVIEIESFVSKNKFVDFFKTLFVKIKYFVKKNEYKLKIILLSVCIACFAFAIGFAIYKLKYWNVYYTLLLCLWALFIYFIYLMILSKNKKTFWIMFSSLLVSFVVLLILTPKTHIMFYEIGVNSNTMEQNIFMGIILLLYMLPLRISYANGNIDDYYNSGIIGYGTFSIALGLLFTFVPDITKAINQSYTTTDITIRLYNLQIPLNIMYIILAIHIVISIIYIANMYKYLLKSKKWLIIVDLVAVIVSIILMLFAIKTLAVYIIWVR